jgi:hypothetical protein
MAIMRNFEFILVFGKVRLYSTFNSLERQPFETIFRYGRKYIDQDKDGKFKNTSSLDGKSVTV